MAIITYGVRPECFTNDPDILSALGGLQRKPLIEAYTFSRRSWRWWKRHTRYLYTVLWDLENGEYQVMNFYRERPHGAIKSTTLIPKDMVLAYLDGLAAGERHSNLPIKEQTQ